RCRRAYRKRIAHWAIIKISRPHGHSMFLIESHGPRVTEPAACSGFRCYAFLECEGGIRAEALPTRFIVAQYVGDNIRCLHGSDARDRMVFGCDKPGLHRESAAGETRVSRSEIGQPDLRVA